MIVVIFAATCVLLCVVMCVIFCRGAPQSVRMCAAMHYDVCGAQCDVFWCWGVCCCDFCGYMLWCVHLYAMTCVVVFMACHFVLQCALMHVVVRATVCRNSCRYNLWNAQVYIVKLARTMMCVTVGVAIGSNGSGGAITRTLPGRKHPAL